MNKICKVLFSVLLSIIGILPLKAEVFTSTYETTQCQDYELLTSMLIGPGVARHPSGAKIPQSKNVQIGVFSNLVAKVVPSFTNGVILSTGNISDGKSLANNSSLIDNWEESVSDRDEFDDDLNAYFDGYFVEPAGIILYIQPKNSTINIPFVMASEEFYANSDYAEYPTVEDYQEYSDKFAFFLKELADASDSSAYDKDGNVIDDGLPMTNNIALLPDGGSVEIASVNQHTNTQYFISNVVSNEYGELLFPAEDIKLPMEFNGAIVGPVAVVEGLDTNKIYKLKIVIADATDTTINSAVFLRERGITSGADLKIDITGPSSIATPGTVTYTDTVSNIGPATADGVTVKHYLPEGVDFSSLVTDCSTGVVDPANWGSEGGTNYFVWTVGDRFASGSNAFLNVTCNLPTKGSYTNIATVVTSTGDYDEANNVDEIETVVGDLPRLRVEAISTNKVYGSEISLSDLGFILSIDGTNETQIVSGIDVTFTNASGKVAYPTNALADVGTYGICISNISDFDLSAFGDRIQYIGGTLEITRRPITIIAGNDKKVYDGTPLKQSGFRVEGLSDGDNHLFTVKMTPDSTITDVGTHPNVIATVDEKPVEIKVEKEIGNYLVTVLPGQLEVIRAKVTVTADDKTKVYGESDPEFTATVTGLKNNDPIDSIKYTLSREAGEAVGIYAITPSGETEQGNYTVVYKNGTLTITRATVTVTADDKTKVYGESDPEFTATVTGLKNNDPIDSIQYTLSREAGEAVGTYAITPAGEAEQGNYTVVYENGTLTITRATVTVKADDKTKVYGESDPEFTATVTGLKNNDPIDSIKYTLSREAGEAVGTYAITPAGEAEQGNYTVVYVPGTLTITRATVTVKADDKTKVYGESDPEFTATVTGLKNNDPIDSIQYTLSREAGEAVGTYAITPAGEAEQGNYTVVYENGTLTITRATVTVKADDKTKVYGESDPEFTATVTGLKNNDPIDSITYTLSREAGEAVGTYAITPTGEAEQGNYTVVYENGKLAITKVELTIIANDASKAYGEVLTFKGDEFTTLPVALPNNDKVTSVVITSEKAADVATPVGEYNLDIKPFHAVTGIDTNNYDIVFSNGTLTVTQAVLTITVNDALWRVGKAKPAYSFADFSAQLKASDTIADITGGNGLATDVVYTNVVWETSEPADADVGTYNDEIWIDATSLDGESAGNYVIEIEPGDLTVDKRIADLKTSISATLNWNTGLLDLTLTIKNEGDGEVEPDYDYWVELKPGVAASGEKASVDKSFYLDSPTGTMPDGYDYIDLTEKVKSALKSAGNGDDVFDPGETVTFTGISLYHWKRWAPSKFIDAGKFFVSGRLFNEADTDKDFAVSEAEKIAAGSLLGTSSADYLEVSRLSLLEFYHWNSEEGTWR